MSYVQIFLGLVALVSVSIAWKDATDDLEQALIDLVTSNNTDIEDTPEVRQLTGKECYVIEPDKPDFNIQGRSVSESKCAEYIWILKQKEIQNKNIDKCRAYLFRQIKAGVIPEFFFIINIPVIFGGRAAQAGEFPHMGAIGWKTKNSDKKWTFKCGGTLISENFVLTAAHCTRIPLRSHPDVAEATPSMIRFGVENIEEDEFTTNGAPTDVIIKRIIVHPNYTPPKKYYDIALLELETNIKFDVNIMPACLWNNPNSRSIGSQVAVTGWGYTEKGHLSHVLQVAYVNVLESELCDSLLLNRRNRHWQGFADNQICAGNLTGGIDACQGDSGGPIQVKMQSDTEGPMYMVMGVTSFGIKCAKRNIPGIYTRVSTFVPWIESVVWNHQLKDTQLLNDKNSQI